LTNLGVHILPLAFPCTLAISDDDWTKLPAFLGQDGSLVNELWPIGLGCDARQR